MDDYADKQSAKFFIIFIANLSPEIVLYNVIGHIQECEELKDMQAILEQSFAVEAVTARKHDPFGRKIGFIVKLFGCWHKKMTRPITNDNLSYRACLDCGARRKFDAHNFKTSRAFYYPLSVTFDRN